MLNLRSLAVFVVVLIALNFLLSEMDYGVHISIAGSLMLTLVVSLLMGGFSGRR
jgi:hypothetical protein